MIVFQNTFGGWLFFLSNLDFWNVLTPNDFIQSPVIVCILFVSSMMLMVDDVLYQGRLDFFCSKPVISAFLRDLIPFHGINIWIVHSPPPAGRWMGRCDVVYPSNKPITGGSVARRCSAPMQVPCSGRRAHLMNMNSHWQPRTKSFPPGFHQHFSSHWWENSGRGQKLYILYKHSSERQHTDSFFGVCENGGGPLSAPLCWCLSTV